MTGFSCDTDTNALRFSSLLFFFQDAHIAKHLQYSLIRIYAQSPFFGVTLSTVAPLKDKTPIAAEEGVGGPLGDGESINHVIPKPQGIIAAALKQNVTFI